jgi:putative transposase
MPILCTCDARQALHAAIEKTRARYPFGVVAWILLPDHMHCIWELPEGDSDFSTRWRLIKTRFTYALSASTQELSPPFWQKRFWEHRIRDETDLNRHIQYIHLNPVKHGLAEKPEDWPFSTYERFLYSGFPADQPIHAEHDKFRVPE